jgi:large subunit ribosomal protein L14
MLQVRSWIKIADNTGVKIANIFGGSGKNRSRFVRVGDVVSASAKQVAANGNYKKGDKIKVAIVRTRKEMRRADGSYIRFDENAGVLVKKDAKGNYEIIGTRIFGPIPREVRDLAKGYYEDAFKKIVSLAPEVI